MDGLLPDLSETILGEFQHSLLQGVWAKASFLGDDDSARYRIASGAKGGRSKSSAGDIGGKEVVHMKAVGHVYGSGKGMIRS